MNRHLDQQWLWLVCVTLIALLVVGCAPANAPAALGAEAEIEMETEGHAEEQHEIEDELPQFAPLPLEGRKLRAVATTNIVGDVVAQIGGDNIDLSTLLAPGVDPHAYQLAPADRQRLEDADVIFINGLGLEDGMLPILDELAASIPVIPVSADIETIDFGGHEGEEAHAQDDGADHEERHEEEAHEGEEGHHHEGVDPHSWQSVPNVIVWTENIANTLSALDPTHAAEYGTAANAYRAELETLNSELHTLVESLPADERKLVTDHDSLGYLAHEYGFTIVGTVIPGLSTTVSASAQALAALEGQITQEGVKAIFVGTTVNPQLAQQLAADLGIKVVPIYTDSLSDANGPAPTYLDFMRYNLQTIVDALR